MTNEFNATADREAFEAWIKHHRPHESLRRKFQGDPYNPGVQCYWEAWQASRAQAAPAVPVDSTVKEPLTTQMPILAADHKGWKVDYSGLLSQASKALKHGSKETGLAELLRQLQGHLEELGKGWYEGDAAVVDEFLQVYCVADDVREVVVKSRGES